MHGQTDDTCSLSENKDRLCGIKVFLNIDYLRYVFFHSGDRIHTSRIRAGNVNCKNSEILCQEGCASKQLQHILPELSPVRQQLPATNLEEVGRQLKAGR